MNVPGTVWKSLLILVVALLGGCAEAATPLAPGTRSDFLADGLLELVSQPIAEETTTTEARIGPEGGTLAIAGGHSLLFPPGALAEETTIRAVRDPDEVRVELSPHGLVFPAAARPVLTFRDPRSGGLLALLPSALFVLYLDDEGDVDEIVGRATILGQGEISVPLQHFSTYALATD